MFRKSLSVNGFVRFLVALLIASLSALCHGSITDPLFIKAELPVHVVFLGVDPKEVGDFTQYVDKSVRPALIDFVKYDVAPLPYSFDVKIIIHSASRSMVEDTAKILREASIPLVSLSSTRETLRLMQLRYNLYVKSLSRYGVDAESVVAVDASYLLQRLVALTGKYIPDALQGYTVYIVCGERLAGRPVTYFHRAVSPDTGFEAYDVGFNVYGGGWWSRSVMVDVCSIPPVEAYEEASKLYKSPAIIIRDTLKTAKNKAELIGLYVDLSVKFAFAKGNSYRPRYEDNVLINIYVVNLSSNSISYSKVERLFNVDMAMAAFKTLYPYAFIQTHIYLLEGKPRYEELRQELKGLIKDKGSYIIIDRVKAVELIERYEIVERPSGVFVIPVFIFMADKSAYLSENRTVGIALPDPQRAGEPWGVLMTIAWEAVREEGLTVSVTQMVGHVAGLFKSFGTANLTGFMNAFAFLPMETAVTDSMSWGPSFRLRFYGVYAFRSYYSIFDIDSIDRGVIVDLLEKARENVLWVIEAGYGELLSSEIGEVEFYYNSAIEEFKRHNYFDRINFKGLGAELSTSFDHAYMAFVKSRELVSLVKQLEGLGVKELRDKVKALEKENSKLRTDLGKAVDEARELRGQVAELEKENSKLRTDLGKAVDEARELRGRVNVFLFLSIALVVSLVAVSLVAVLLRRRLLRRR